MARKRKRGQPSIGNAEQPSKRVHIGYANTEKESVKHPTLCLYYTEILTLKGYLLSNLPTNSKTRRRRVASADIDILDKIVVCKIDDRKPSPDLARSKDFEAFSQQVSLTAGSSIGERSSSQSDLIDFAIWLLFHRIHRHTYRPQHLLCHGYQRASNLRELGEDHCAVAGIPGLVSHYPNNNVNVMKDANWTEILGLLGKEGDRIMLDLVLECGVFAEVAGGQGNYYQLSGRIDPFFIVESCLRPEPGIPLTEMATLISQTSPVPRTVLQQDSMVSNGLRPRDSPQTSPKSPAAISFVRNRMFYARAALNAKGRVTFSLRHIRESELNISIHFSLSVFRRLESVPG